jgi:hypothetical protein
MNHKKYLKLKYRVQSQTNKYRPIKGYSRDTLAENLFNSFTKLFPDGSPSEALTKYAIRKTKILPAYPIR